MFRDWKSVVYYCICIIKYKVGEYIILIYIMLKVVEVLDLFDLVVLNLIFIEEFLWFVERFIKNFLLVLFLVDIFIINKFFCDWWV